MTLFEIVAYLVGAGGLLTTGVAALWKERITKRDYQRLQDKHDAREKEHRGEIAALVAKHAEEIHGFVEEHRRITELRSESAERRGGDTAQALDRVTRGLTDSTRVITELAQIVRDNTAALSRAERERGRTA